MSSQIAARGKYRGAPWIGRYMASRQSGRCPVGDPNTIPRSYILYPIMTEVLRLLKRIIVLSCFKDVIRVMLKHEKQNKLSKG
jgi:hypothetical protein